MSRRREIWARAVFAIRYKYSPNKWIRTQYYRFLGATIGRGTRVAERTVMVWPHQVQLGAHCKLEHGIYFHFDGIYERGPSIVVGDHTFLGHHVEFNVKGGVTLGAHCLIAAGCRFVDHNHGMVLGSYMKDQDPGPASPIAVGNDVWLGADVIVLAGVTIGDGAVVGAGAIVGKSIPANEIWAGVPARKIRDR